MLVTNFRLKYVIYEIVFAFYQRRDIGRIHPMRERSLRALQRTTDYIERAMPDTVGFEAPTSRDTILNSASYCFLKLALGWLG
jgi:hypothetical protein